MCRIARGIRPLEVYWSAMERDRAVMKITSANRVSDRLHRYAAMDVLKAV